MYAIHPIFYDKMPRRGILNFIESAKFAVPNDAKMYNIHRFFNCIKMHWVQSNFKSDFIIKFSGTNIYE